MLKKLIKTDGAERFTRPLKTTDGFILIIGLLILLLLTALGAVALRTTTTETQITGNDRSSNGMLFAADAGIERAKNQIWADSGFGNTGTSLNLSTITTLLSPLPKQIFTTSLASGLYYTVKATAAANNGSYVDVTLESQAWRDTNGNSTYDPGEQTKTVIAVVRYSYTSMNFPFGLMTENTECLFCHTQINGDVVSLDSMTIRKTNEAYSIINGKVYTAGTTNVNDANSRVVKSYVDQNGNYATVENAGETAVDITVNYTDPRFPLDKNGNPSWPQIGNLTYYKGLAAAYNGTGSTVSGGTIKGVPTGGTYPGNAVTLASVSQTYAGNLILDGTSSCIVLNGPIVADKDVIIKGCVKGTGTIYAGGNVYAAGAITYNDSANDKLSLAAGGNVVMGDYTGDTTGGQSFIDKQLQSFNDDQAASGIPAGQRRYYADETGAVSFTGKSTPPPSPGDTIVSYTPTSNWITAANYTSGIMDTTNGISRIDALIYTPNAILGINKIGNMQTTINGALVSADTGILTPGPNGHDTTYTPSEVGLTINYDSRMANFLSVARNPVKKIVSWKEK